MNVTAEERIMYSVMKAVYDSGIPISFKGSMVLKACLFEAGFLDETRHTVDIDANWNTDTPPTAEQMVESLQRAINRGGMDYEVRLYRMYGEKRSAGFELVDRNTDEILFTMDVDVNRPITPTQIYEVDGICFRGVSPLQMIADKVAVVSTGKVFRRIKDVVDLYYISKVFEFDVQKIYSTLKCSERIMGDFQGFLQRKEDLRHSYDNNWIVENLTNAFGVWNSKMTEMWSLLTESPQTFKGGTIWQTIVTINGGMQAIGYGLLVLFFAIGIFRSASGFRDFQRPEHLLRHFIYFVLAKLGITYGMDLLVNIFDVCSGIVATAAGSIGGLTGASVALPQEIADAIGDVGFLASIPLWLVTLLGSLFITVLAFIMILTVYGRFFKIYMYAALSPVALASFAGEGTSHFGKAFLRSYVGVCMEGAVIVLACIIFSAFSSSGTPVVDSSASVVTQVWSYLGEVIFNLLVLVGLVKSADHIAKEMLGL